MPQPAPGGPTVLRMIIARQLQVLRENAGLSYEQAANAIYTSAWTVRRMERADGGIRAFVEGAKAGLADHLLSLEARTLPPVPAHAGRAATSDPIGPPSAKDV